MQQSLRIGDVDETELGGNVGFGLMAFAWNLGFRGDVRYFSQIGDLDTDMEFPRTSISGGPASVWD